MKFFVTITSIVCVGCALLPLQFQYIALPLVFTILFLYDKKILKQFTRKSFLLITVLLLIIQPLISGGKHDVLFNVEYSGSAFKESLQMIFRAFFIMTSISLLVNKMDKNVLLGKISKTRLRHFKPAFEEAHNLFPVINSAVRNSFKSYSGTGRKISINPINMAAMLIASAIKTSNEYQKDRTNGGNKL